MTHAMSKAYIQDNGDGVLLYKNYQEQSMDALGHNQMCQHTAILLMEEWG